MFYRLPILSSTCEIGRLCCGIVTVKMCQLETKCKGCGQKAAYPGRLRGWSNSPQAIDEKRVAVMLDIGPSCPPPLVAPDPLAVDGLGRGAAPENYLSGP